MAAILRKINELPYLGILAVNEFKIMKIKDG